jgi:hypothetical protein
LRILTAAGSTELLALTNTGLLQFAGTTNAFPALKRNGAAIAVSLADDSGSAAVSAVTLGLTQGAAVPATVAATLYVDATGALKLKLADGTIKTVTVT